MSYNRVYSVEDINIILCASEHRPRPDKPPGIGKKGHALSLHTEERKDFFSRPGVPSSKLPKKDSIFLGSRNSLVMAVHEVMNSIPGQNELAKLNQANVNFVEIRGVILRQGNEFDIFTVYRPRGQGEQTSFDWLSIQKGDGYIVQLCILVFKLPSSKTEDIHIHTAFPEDYARTLGDEILRP